MWRRKSFRICMAIFVAVSPQSIAQRMEADGMYQLSITPASCVAPCLKNMAAPLVEPHPLAPIHRMPQGASSRYLYAVKDVTPSTNGGLTHVRAIENIFSDKD